MPIFRLVEDTVFPPPDYADPSGLIAVGGDLSSERLLEAYRVGIFPWYSDDQPILWWSPDPRFILEPDEFKMSRSLQKTLQRKTFQVTFDRVFEEVIAACATVPREGQRGTWITREMHDAYIELHGLGLAHLVEKLKSWGFHFIDSQMTTEHMMRLGAKEVPRRIFLKRLQSALRHSTKRGKWHVED